MAAPKYTIVQKSIQNPHASAPLTFPILVLSNTSDEDLERNIRTNAARDLKWVAAQPQHDRIAVLVGGGPSLADCLEDVRALRQAGAVVFAINAASRFLRSHGIVVDYQVIADAKEETASLADPHAKAHLFASQVNPKTAEAVERPTLWHLGNVEEYFPVDRIARGGYALIGGEHTGNSLLCLAYTLGFRDLHCFGYDSSHREGASHAYRQAMNDFIPTVDVEWAGRTFTASVAMKAQAEKFPMIARQLQTLGCAVQVHGDGLLPHMHAVAPENLTERDKYRLMWQFDSYRLYSPGEGVVDGFLELAKPDGLVIDYGCGTGRAAIRMHERGLPVLLMDFADNCRDHEALELPFIEHDLTQPMPVRGRVGYCTDVMEHIPESDVERVLENMFEATPRVFFQIDTEADHCGALISHELHVTLWSHAKWREVLARYGEITHEYEADRKSVFYVVRSDVQ